MNHIGDGVRRAISLGRWAFLLVLPYALLACNNGGGGSNY